MLPAVVLVAGSTAMGQGDVLVWSTGGDCRGTQGVADYLMATGHFDSVTAIDRDKAFTLDDLLQYDGVLFFSAYSRNQNPVAIGNVLADYAEAGRCVVLAVFCWANQGANTLGGRIISDGLSPFVLEGLSLYRSVTMAGNDGSIFFENVETLSGFFHDDVRLTANAIEHGTWTDHEPIVASKRNVIGVNLFPNDSWGLIGGDYDDLFANAFRGCSGGGCGEMAKLRVKCKGQGIKVTGTLRKANPNTHVTFRLDGGQARPAITNGKGRAMTKWMGQQRGGHTVSVCQLEGGC